MIFFLHVFGKIKQVADSSVEDEQLSFCVAQINLPQLLFD